MMSEELRLEPAEPLGSGLHICPFCKGRVRVVMGERQIEHLAPACRPFDEAMRDAKRKIVVVFPFKKEPVWRGRD